LAHGIVTVVPFIFPLCSSRQGKAVKCSYRASTGALYPLDKEFLFLPKPVLFTRFKDVSDVTIARCAPTPVRSGGLPTPPMLTRFAVSDIGFVFAAWSKARVRST